MDKKKNRRKSKHLVSTISTAEDRKSVRGARPKSVVEDSRTTKGWAAVEETTLDDDTRLAKEAKPVAEAVPGEAPPNIKENTDDLPALPKSVDTQPPAVASPTDLQERASNEDKIPMVALLETAEVKTDEENPEIDKVTGVQLLAAWQPQKGTLGLPGIDLTRIFGNGLLQFTALLIAMIAQFALVCHNLIYNVVAPNVDHWCKQPPEYFNITSEEWRDISAPRDANGVWNQCLRYEPPLSEPSSNRSKLPCKEWDYEGGSGSSIITEWDLVCERRWLLTLANAGYVIGAIASTPIAGTLSDEVGRRPVICVSATVLVISGIAVCFTTTFAAFVVLRVFVVASVCNIRMTSLVLLFELSPPRHQWRYCVFAVGAGLTLAPVFLGVLDIFKTNWILAQALMMLPTSLLVCAFNVTPESPRWLMSKGKYEDVEQVILWAARRNEISLHEAKGQWRPILEALRQFDLEAPVQGKSCLSGTLSSRTLLCRTGILSFFWFIAVIAYYARLRTRRTVSLWLLGAGIALKVPCFFLMYQFLKRKGRRLTLCAVFTGFCLVFGCATLLTELELFWAMAEVMHWLTVGVLAALMAHSLPETTSCPIVDTIKDMEEESRRKKLARIEEILMGPAAAAANQSKK
ncbi:unnamed protein product, partial [Ixodes hexagonus]